MGHNNTKIEQHSAAELLIDRIRMEMALRIRAKRTAEKDSLEVRGGPSSLEDRVKRLEDKTERDITRLRDYTKKTENVLQMELDKGYYSTLTSVVECVSMMIVPLLTLMTTDTSNLQMLLQGIAMVLSALYGVAMFLIRKYHGKEKKPKEDPNGKIEVVVHAPTRSVLDSPITPGMCLSPVTPRAAPSDAAPSDAAPSDAAPSAPLTV